VKRSIYALRASGWKANTHRRLGALICVNQETNNEAIMKIRMQIPHQGTTHATAKVRAAQASTNPAWMGQNEHQAFEILNEANCSYAPQLQNYKQIKQTKAGIVPGGYICYFLMNKLPGISLGTCFWDLNRGERDDIRAAFKKAYEDIRTAGIINLTHYRENLIWDKSNSELYVFIQRNILIEILSPIGIW